MNGSTASKRLRLLAVAVGVLLAAWAAGGLLSGEAEGPPAADLGSRSGPTETAGPGAEIETAVFALG